MITRLMSGMGCYEIETDKSVLRYRAFKKRKIESTFDLIEENMLEDGSFNVEDLEGYLDTVLESKLEALKILREDHFQYRLESCK